MSTTEQDMISFLNFVRLKLDSGPRDVTLDELFDQWRIENPSDEQYAENVAALQASINDFKAGERGSIASEHSAKLRSEFGMRRQ